MIPWLIPISLYWTLAAVYLGGSPLEIEGGGGGQQILGLLLHFAAYMVAYAIVRILFTGPLGEIVGGIVVPILVASILLPVLGKVAFRVVGVRIVSVG